MRSIPNLGRLQVWHSSPKGEVLELTDPQITLVTPCWQKWSVQGLLALGYKKKNISLEGCRIKNIYPLKDIEYGYTAKFEDD